MNADKNLLLGLLALQLNFVDRNQLVAAFDQWMADKTQSLGQVFVNQRALADDEYVLLEALVAKHVERHDNDAQKSLAHLTPDHAAREALKSLADADVEASLTLVSAVHDQRERPLPATLSYSAGASSSLGTRFRILRPHAQGGLGEVYLALDEELHREVALKEIQQRHANEPDSRARFVLEAEITGGLEHPGIVPVYGLGTYADGRPFYAMRFIRGSSLHDAIRQYHRARLSERSPAECGLDLRELLGRFIDVCNAIEYAHSRGVLHRDLKPGNIMLGKYGETLVVDWGLAKATGQRESRVGDGERTLRPVAASASTQTQVGSAMGTPQYMSPEQANGQLDNLGPTTDVYSLGATLYCLLTGRAPFADGDAGTTIAKVAAGDFPPPRAVKRDVPRALEAICMKAMALKTTERYDSPRAMANDIEHWLADEPVSVYREPLAASIRRWGNRHQRSVSVVAATTVVAMACLGIGLRIVSTKNRDLIAANDKERKSTEAARQNAELARANSELAREQLYLTRQQLAQAAWQESDVNLLYDLLARQQPEQGQADLRGFEWQYLDSLCATEKLVYRGHARPVSTVACSPDGRLAASGGFDGEVHVWDTSTGATRYKKHVNDMTVNCLAFSPNGESLACAGNLGQLSLYDTATGTETARLNGHGVQVFGVAFSPDASRLASAGADGTVRIWELPTGSPLHVCRGHQNMVWSVTFDPQSKFIASGSSDGTVRVWDVASGAQVHNFVGHSGFVTGVAYNPNGAQLASVSRAPMFSSGDGEIKLWNVPQAREEGSLRGHTGSVNFLAYSPDGMFLATGGDDRTIKVWNVHSKQATSVHKGHTSGVTGVALNADGTVLYSAGADATVRVWNTFATPGRSELPVAMVASIKSIFSPTGKYLAASSEARVQIFEAATGRKIAELFDTVSEPTRVYPEITAVAFSPDEQNVVGLRHNLDLPGEAVVWNIDTKQPLKRLTGHAAIITSLDWSPDGKWIVSASHDKTLKTWNAETGKEIATFEGHEFPVEDVKIGPEGLQIASVAAAPPNRPFDQNPPPRLGEVIIWDVASGKAVRKLGSGDGPAFCLAFSPTQKLLGVGGNDGILRLWSLDTGELHAECKGHTAAIHATGFSRDGRRLATGADDATVRVWDVRTGQELLVLRGHTKSIASVDFAPDDRRLASSTSFTFSAGEIILWGGSAKDDLSVPAENTSAIWHEHLLQQAMNANDAFGATYHARALRTAAVGNLNLARQCADAMVRFREFALAEEFYLAAINMAPADAELRHRLGHTFVLRGDLPGAAAVYRELTEIAPEFGDGFYSLGNTLRDQGDLRGATEAFQNAVRVKPDFAEGHCNLGSVLQRRGFFVEALVELKRGHELGSARPDWRYPSAQWVAQAERFVTLEAQWLAIQRGEAKPAGGADLIGLAQVCAFKGHNLAAAQFYKDAITSLPEFVADPANGFRYNAACAAALTSGGIGDDAGSLDADARCEWRRLALEWLRADLNEWQSRLGAATPQVRASINAALAHWRQDTDLSVVRDAAAIAQLSDDERTGWIELWHKVEDLLSASTAKPEPLNSRNPEP